MKKVLTQISIILLVLAISSVQSAEKCSPDFEMSKSSVVKNNQND